MNCISHCRAREALEEILSNEEAYPRPEIVSVIARAGLSLDEEGVDESRDAGPVAGVVFRSGLSQCLGNGPMKPKPKPLTNGWLFEKVPVSRGTLLVLWFVLLLWLIVAVVEAL